MQQTAELHPEKERQLLKEDTSRQHDFKQVMSEFAPVVTNLMEAWKPLNLGEVSLDTLANNRHRYELYVKELLYEASPTMKELPIERSQAIKMMTLPKAYPAFAQAMEEYLDILKRRQFHTNLATSEIFWTADKEGNYVPSKAYLEYVDKHTRVYATDKALQAYKMAEEIRVKLDELQQLIGNDSIVVIPTGHGLIKAKWMDKGFEVNKELMQFVK